MYNLELSLIEKAKEQKAEPWIDQCVTMTMHTKVMEMAL
jgi:hypothetical protein